jgi:hypothetical protein
MTDYTEKFNAVIAELKGDYNTLENANRIFKRVIISNEQCSQLRKYRLNDRGFIFMYHLPYYLFDCVFGRFDVQWLENKTFKMVKKNIEKSSKSKYSEWFEWIEIKPKNGIEVLGMKPERTKDGKYTYKGLIISELKQSCKNNGIKGITKMDKCELVNALIKL